MAVGRSLAAALVLLAACSGATTRAGPSLPGRAPFRIGDHSFCTVAAPVTSTGRIYFPSHYPPEAIPDAERCFHSVEDARGAGFHAAPLPTGSHLVGGVYLMPAAPQLSATCRRAAARLGFSVACPTLAPSPAETLELISHIGRQFLLQEQFGAPPTYVGAGTVGFGGRSVGHLWVASSPTPMNAGSICFDPMARTRPASVRGHRAAFASCPEGSSTHSGHVVLFWSEAGAWHLVSLHGHTAVNRRMDQLIARTSEMIRP
jgi:hypothetical protein